MVSFCYSQTKFKKIQLDNEFGLWLNEPAMDLVYNKYLSFNKLENEFKILSLNYQITLVDLEQVKDELKHKETNYILLVKELEDKYKLKTQFHKAEIKTLKNKKFKNLLFGIGAGLIVGLVISN